MLIRDTLVRATHHRALELALFELVGQWAPVAGDADATRVLAAQSHHHAWRASMWGEVAPVLHDVPSPDPAGDVAAAVSSLADRRLGDLADLLSALAAGYEAELAGCGEVADAPVARVLRLVLLDTRADLDALRAVVPG